MSLPDCDWKSGLWSYPLFIVIMPLAFSHPLKTHNEPVPGIATRLGSTCGVVIKHTTVGLDVSMQKTIAAKLLASSFVLASRRFPHTIALTSESYNGLYRNSCFCYHKGTWCFACFALHESCGRLLIRFIDYCPFTWIYFGVYVVMSSKTKNE